MTFTQVLHGVLDHYSGDEASERRYRKQMEKQNRKVLKDFWETIPTDLRADAAGSTNKVLGHTTTKDAPMDREEECKGKRPLMVKMPMRASWRGE